MIDPADQVVEAVERVLRGRYQSADVREWAVTVASVIDDSPGLRLSRPPGGVDDIAALERYIVAQQELFSAWHALGRTPVRQRVEAAFEDRRLAELCEQHGEDEGWRRYEADASRPEAGGDNGWMIAALSVLRDLPRYRSKANLRAMAVAGVAVDIWCELGPGREPSDGNAAFLEFLRELLAALDVDADERSALKAWRRSHRKPAGSG